MQRWVQRVVFSGRDVVGGEQDEKEQQRHGPGMLEGHALPSLEQTLCFAPFRSLLYIGVVSAYRCLKVFLLVLSAAQHTLAGAVISSCLVASAPTPVSPLGSLPRFELFLLRPALATFAPPFCDVRFPFVGVAIEGNGSTPFFPAAMTVLGEVVQCMLADDQRRNVGVFEDYYVS